LACMSGAPQLGCAARRVVTGPTPRRGRVTSRWRPGLACALVYAVRAVSGTSRHV
jgi:hypothetical protein